MKNVMLTLMFLIVTSLSAHDVYVKAVDEPLQTLYPKLLASLKQNQMMVVSEIDILAKFKEAGLPEKFGKEFNTNDLEGVKAIIACNGFFGNAVANADPEMMALCPVRITLIQHAGKSKILYSLPSKASQGSDAHAVLEKLESKVIAALEGAF